MSMGMQIPVICRHCAATYDLAKVTITSHYADATCYKTPCCNRDADDRQWKSLPDFTHLKNLRAPDGRIE